MPNATPNHLFDHDGRFYIPTTVARGPWSPKALHGGPPAALLAHALEGERGDPGLMVSRMTIDLFRPVPYAPLELKTRVVREGRRIKLVDAWILAEGTEVARAVGLMLRRDPPVVGGAASLQSGGAVTVPPGVRPIPPWQDVPLRHFSQRPVEGVELFHARMIVRRIDPQQPGQPMAAWMQVPLTLLPETPLAPLERLAAVSDFVSAMGTLSRAPRKPFINADINIALHREPEGEWICLEGAGRGDQDGIGSSSVNFHDSRGLFGHGFASAIVN